MTLGLSEQSIINQCIAQRLPLPPAIANAPELRLGLGLFYKAFFALTSCRAIGDVDGPIPWLAIRQYADRLGLDEDQTEDLHYHISAMDEVYLKRQREKIEALTRRK